MKVPLADLHTQYLFIKKEVDAAIHQVIDNSQFILGKAVIDFEQEFARFHNVKHCVAVGSGTDAIHAALWSLEIGPGDKVITTPFTFIATAASIVLTGATPVFVDIDPETFNIDPKKIETVLTSNSHNVKAILPVYLYGQATAVDEIIALSRKYNIDVIEDAAQSHAAKYRNVYVGNFGAAGCFSFYPGKNLGAYGEGGAIVTNDDERALKLRRLRDHGQVEKYRYAFVGHNYRMDGIQGAVLGVKMKYLRQWTDRRRTIASLYNKELHGVGDLVLPFADPDAYHVYHLYTIRTKKRSALQQHLASHDIATTIAYPIPLHFQQAYQHLGYTKGDFPEAEQAAEECLSIPIYAEMTDDQIAYVITKVKSFFQ